MRILLVGEYRCNMGPANVNKKIIEHMQGDFLYIKFQWPRGLNRILSLIELIIKLFFSQVIIVSVTSRIGYIAGKLCKCFHKTLVLIMHGCIDYESEINGNKKNNNGKKWEKYLMEQATIILPVSKKYGEWLKDRYPTHKKQIKEWTLGYDGTYCKKNYKKNRGLILAAGGNTPQKNNNQVSDAVALMDEVAKLEIYGPINSNWPQKINNNTFWVGQTPNDLFLEKLSCAEIFIVNSTLESFSISLMEALSCGCNILVSSNVGALDLLKVESTDIINDVNDTNEIKMKIQNLMEHPNHDRICENIDWDAISWNKSIGRLREICEELYKSSF